MRFILNKCNLGRNFANISVWIDGLGKTLNRKIKQYFTFAQSLISVNRVVSSNSVSVISLLINLPVHVHQEVNIMYSISVGRYSLMICFNGRRTRDCIN